MQILLRKALLVSAFFIVCQRVLAGCDALPVERQVRVVQVIDGDTVRLVDGSLVRLIGINTPEIGRDGRADEVGAQQAKARLQRWIEGRELAFSAGLERRDHYGRLLGHLTLAGQSVAEQLIAEGLGFAVAIAPDLRQADCLFAAENRARRARLGLWRQAPVMTAGDVAAAGFVLVCGRVTRMDRTRRAYFVELDDHLALRIDQAGLTAAQQAWLGALPGTRLEARGWVVDRGESAPGHPRWLIGLSDLRGLQSCQP